jgi:hypothetical protein
MSIVKIEMWKTFSSTLTIAKLRKRITNPVTAWVILFRADSTCALSPPEVIHDIAPVTKLKKNSVDPAIKNIVISNGRSRAKNCLPDKFLI